MTTGGRMKLAGFGLLGILLLAGCGKPAKVQLGPKPAPHGDPATIAEKGKQLDDFRAWLEKLSPTETKTLEEHGQVVIIFAELKQSDPAIAQMLSDNVAKMRARIEKSYQAKGRVLPATNFREIIDIIFTKPTAGKYDMRVDFQDGSGIETTLSEPQRASRE